VIKEKQNMKKAFTLIELLIVVAIIAILAAIAVPNFLEAQTRSKASRMKSDMRSVATGMEAYCVDNNKYPFGFNSVSPRYGLAQLSTPIAYMTNPLIPDVFMPPGAVPWTPPTAYDLAIQYSLRGINGTAVDVGISGVVDGQQGQWWLLRSWGPDKIAQAYSASIANNDVVGIVNTVYDATNGTVSLGNIYRVGGPPSLDAGKALAACSNK
jgi:prepilin-type N-terminal cleavage/methylation domain-containing protein